MKHEGVIVEPKASLSQRSSNTKVGGRCSGRKKEVPAKNRETLVRETKLWSTKTKGGEGKIILTDKRERTAIQLGDHGQRQFGKLGPRAKQEERDKNEQKRNK